MPVLSKLKYVKGACSELAHPWQPSCILANKEFMITCLMGSFKLYAMFYAVSNLSSHCSQVTLHPSMSFTYLYSIPFLYRPCILPSHPSLSLRNSLHPTLTCLPSLPSPPLPSPPVFIQFTALANRKGLKHFILHSVPAVLRSTIFLSLNGGPLLFWICVLR